MNKIFETSRKPSVLPFALTDLFIRLFLNALLSIGPGLIAPRDSPFSIHFAQVLTKSAGKI
jgi:hypothetical protein